MNYVIMTDDESSGVKPAEMKNKSFTKLKDEFLIERIIRIARNCGASKLFLIIQKQEQELKQILLSKSLGLPVQLIVSITKNTMEDLFTLAPQIANEPFCLIARNSIFDETEFKDFVNYSSLQSNVDGTVAVTRYSGKINPGSVAMDDEENIIKFSDSSEGYNWVTGGIYYFSPKVFDELQYALDRGILKLKNFLRLLITHNYLLKGISFSQIITVKNNADIEKASEFILSLKP